MIRNDPVWRKCVLATLPAALMVLQLACKSDPWTDGRYWRQPLPKSRVRPMAVSVGRMGDTATSDIGPGFRLSSDWPESGGGSTGRQGFAVREGVWRERTVSTGDWYDASRTGTHSEAKVRPSIVGGTVVSQTGSETNASVGVSQRIDY